MMTILDLIEIKRDKKEWSSAAIVALVDSVCDLSTPDYQITALLMAIYLNGLTDRETSDLTLAMARSGEMIDFSGINEPIVDKHSTGGVGDKTSLVLMPLLAASGIKVSKLSGKGLGHTGGTLDKLSIFPGFRFDLTTEEIIHSVKEIGIVISGQTEKLVPADKRLYALRDATSTVNSLPLIASSIMSKKIATGASHILLDVKVGNGAIFDDLQKARLLAKKMVDIGHSLNIKTKAVLTGMSTPLGMAVGNALEVKEAIETLGGRGSAELRNLCIELGARIIQMLGREQDIQLVKKELSSILDSGKALDYLKLMLENQGSSTTFVDQPEDIPLAPLCQNIFATQAGFIHEIHARKIGLASMAAGAGRLYKDQPIDLGAGVLLHKKEGEQVIEHELLATVYASDEDLLQRAAEQAAEAILIGLTPNPPLPLIIGEI